MDSLNFDEVKQILQGNVRQILADICPGGRMIGDEWTCGTISGGKGDSFKFNVKSQRWADFATDARGGDVISLYACQRSIKQLDAAKELSERYGKGAIPVTTRRREPEKQFVPAPIGTKPPDISGASGLWEYKTIVGETAFWVARFQNGTKKFFTPYSWDGWQWERKAWTSNRPILNLDKVKALPNKAILVVEGEKCAEAATKLQSDYIVVTWSGGAGGVSKTDFSPLRGRNIVLWPDNDKAGANAMFTIAEMLAPFCDNIRMLGVPIQGKPQGWDIADAIEEGMNWKQVAQFARLHAAPFKKPEPLVEVMPQDNEPPHTADDEDEQTVTTKQAFNLQELGIHCVNGKLELNEANISMVFRADERFKNNYWFDEFHQKFFVNKDGVACEMQEHDYIGILISLQQHDILRKLKLIVLKAAFRYWARTYSVKNEPKDWLESLVWDSKPRIDTYLFDRMGCSQTDKYAPYTQAVSKNFFLMMVARILKPGCKVDNMVILESKQGQDKSKILRAIAGKYFAETNCDPTHKDFIVQIQGKMLVEFAELSTFSKSDANALKQVITCEVDRVRLPYAETAIDAPRTCVFTGTTNNKDYLRDTTGNRRFWPVEVGTLDVEGTLQDRDQLFAEAVARFKEGESWWNVPLDLAEEIQGYRMYEEFDDWETLIEQYLKEHTSTMPIEIYTNLFKGLTSQYVNARDGKRICKILRKLGWDNKHHRDAGSVSRRWRPVSVEG